jgi:hypothetical protein
MMQVKDVSLDDSYHQEDGPLDGIFKEDIQQRMMRL